MNTAVANATHRQDSFVELVKAFIADTDMESCHITFNPNEALKGRTSFADGDKKQLQQKKAVLDGLDVFKHLEPPKRMVRNTILRSHILNVVHSVWTSPLYRDRSAELVIGILRTYENTGYLFSVRSFLVTDLSKPVNERYKIQDDVTGHLFVPFVAGK